MGDYSLEYTFAQTESYDGLALTFFCFDTWCSIAVYGRAAARELLIELREQCLRFHELWSFSLPGSDVARLNERAARVEVAPETAALLRAMLAFHQVEPLFDFTIGSVSYLWKHARALPSQPEIAAALQHVGAEGVRVEGATVVKDDPLTCIDVGASAKGFIADALAGFLRAEGVSCADIDLGGNLYLLGQHPAGRPWRVDVGLPEGYPKAPPRFEVTDTAVVTSSCFERSMVIDGTSYHHIIDPQTGWPIGSSIASATVVHPSALQADLLATTALLAGAQGADALAARHPQARFYLVA